MQIKRQIVSRETQARLDQLKLIFFKWQKRINLVSASTLDDFEKRHVIDSAQILDIAPDANRIVDMGSGGGFPGLVLAIMLAEKQNAHVDLIESNQKKASFLRSALRECGGVGIVHAERIEKVTATLLTPDIITARALAPLDVLLDYSLPLLAENVSCLFHKGRDYEEEIVKARGRFQFDLLVYPSRIDPDSVILKIWNVEPLTN